jgi:hypothetical protein
VVAVFEGAGLVTVLPGYNSSHFGLCQWTGGSNVSDASRIECKMLKKKEMLLKKEEKRLDAWIQCMQGRNVYLTKTLEAGPDFGGLYITRNDLLKQRQQRAGCSPEIIGSTTENGDMLQLILATQRGSMLTIPTPPDHADVAATDSSSLSHFQYSLKVSSKSHHQHDRNAAPAVPQQRPIAAYILEGESKGQALSKLDLMPKPPLLQTCCSDVFMQELEDHVVVPAPPQLTSTSSESSVQLAMMLHAALFESSSSRIHCRT